MEEQCKNLQNKITSEDRIRHDWRHHVIAISGFVDKKDLDGLGSYLEEYKEKYISLPAPRLCNLDAIDMLFQYYKRKAGAENIRIEIAPVVIEDYRVDVSDLIVVFGNMLTNAIEGCKRMTGGEQYIYLKAERQHDGMIGIVCENSFDGILILKNDKAISRKQKGGIGLSSMGDIAERNNGVMQFKAEGTVFFVYVAMR